MCFPSQPPQQQNEIRLRSVPRSGAINLEWNRMQNIDVNELLNRKRRKTQDLGCASLVGEVAKIIENKISQSNESYKFGGMTFVPKKSDIKAEIGPISSYKTILEEMQKEGTATKETAEQILKNLSKGRIAPDEKGIFHLDELENEIFEGLNNFAKKLMAVLICETIRFNDDGASARMAMRLVINKFENESIAPFEDVFVGAEGKTPLSIFAAEGGKQRMIEQILGRESAFNKDSFFEQDEKILKGNKNFISDDEDEGKDGSSSVFSLNTSSPSIHPMQTRNKGEHSQGFYEDPPSSAVPSPARRQISAVRTFGNHEAMPFNLDELSEEQGTDTSVPLGEHFCQNCNLLYWRAFGRSDEPILNECPNCHSTDFITMIPDENVVYLVTENHKNQGSKAYFQNYIEGIFVEK